MAVTNYQHILLAVDFSPEMAQVAERAIQIQGQYDARLTLVHVVEYMPMSYSGDLVLPEDFDLEAEMVEVASKQLRELGDPLGVPAGQCRVEVGAPGKTLLRVARELGIDLIVIGSHGRQGIAALLGSTARRVTNGAECDVLAVRIREA